MVFFWIGMFCTYLLALFSWPRLRDAIGPRLWGMFRTIALEYIAIAFAADSSSAGYRGGAASASFGALPAFALHTCPLRSGSARR